MLSRFKRRAPITTSFAASGAGGFEVMSAHLDGRDVRVFVAPQGTAAAVEMGQERATVLTGLAAGIILSDVEEAARGPAHGLGARSSRIGRLDARGADAVIDGLPALTDGQKDQLRSALSL